MQQLKEKSFLLFLAILPFIVSCRFVKDYVQRESLGGLAKVKRAAVLYKKQEYESAILLCIDAINNGSQESIKRRAKLQLARIYFETRQFEKTISLYDELLGKPAPDILITDVTNYIDLLKRTGKITRAKEICEIYAHNYKNNVRLTNIRESLVNYYNFYNRDSAESMQVDSLRLNLPGYQYGLALYQQNLVFLSNDIKKNEQQSFYTNSKLYMISEDHVEPFSNSLRGVLQMGPASFFDNDQRVIYTSNRYEDVKNDKNSFINYKNTTQLLYAVYQPNHQVWSKPLPIKLTQNMESYSFLHPAVTPDGSRLYFASDMPGGKGGTDIYYTDWDKLTKRWKTPVNMGSEVNTNGNELYPFIVNSKLFFASNGHFGFGGLDIFVININKLKEGTLHLPFPVNTQFDDLNPVLDISKQCLYFTSDRSGAHDNDHIYVLNLANNYLLKQLEFSYAAKTNSDLGKDTMKINSKDEKALTGNAPYYFLPANKKTGGSVTAAGEAVSVSMANRIINSNPEYISWQQDMTIGHTDTAVDSNAAAPPVNVDNTTAVTGFKKHADVVMQTLATLWAQPNVIYFNTNAHVPKDQEWHKLDAIFKSWEANPQRNIVISGHTDTVGTEKYNWILSKNRAAYIQACLHSKGVQAHHIKINYFGSTKPMLAASMFNQDAANNVYIQLQSVNRRCEIKIQ